MNHIITIIIVIFITVAANIVGYCGYNEFTATAYQSVIDDCYVVCFFIILTIVVLLLVTVFV